MHIKMIFQKLNIIGKKAMLLRAFQLNGGACMQKNNDFEKNNIINKLLFFY